MSRQFWLVQRVYPSPAAAFAGRFPSAKVRSNPFGYGRLGDYELDYMGAAEFEFGEIPKAATRLSKGKLQSADHEYKGRTLRFLFLKADGDPFRDWQAWANGTQQYQRRPFDGKEPPFGFKDRLDGKRSEYDKTEVWWALNENVMWAFVEADGTCHLNAMLESMGSVPSEFLR